MINLNFEQCLNDLNKNGITIIDRALDERTLSDISIKFDKVASLKSSNGKAIGSTEEEEMIWIDHPLALDRNLLKIASCANISKLIKQYLGVDVQLGYTFAYRTKVMQNVTPEIQNLIKAPGVFKGWHSDANLSTSTRGYRCVVAMLYLTDVEKGDGGLWVVKGSHNYGGARREWEQNQFDENKIQEVEAKAGSIIIFDMEMIHRAGTPSNLNPRDIVRFMYTPMGSYSEDYLIPASFVDDDLSEGQRRILRFSTTSTHPVTLSEQRGSPIVNKKSLSSFLKKQLLKLLV